MDTTLLDRSTSPRTVWNTSTFASSCLNRCTILKTRRKEKKGLSPGIGNALPPPPFAKLCRSLSGAKRSSPHLWPKSGDKATGISFQKVALFACSQRSVTNQTAWEHECFTLPRRQGCRRFGISFITSIWANIWIPISAVLFHFLCQDTSASRIKATFVYFFDFWVPLGSLNLNTSLWTALSTARAEKHKSLVFPAHFYQLFPHVQFRESNCYKLATKLSHQTQMLLFCLLASLDFFILILLLWKHHDRSQR